jgi:ABC-type Zn2+ transport system substrate-binding protein/surface adhesin
LKTKIKKLNALCVFSEPPSNTKRIQFLNFSFQFFDSFYTRNYFR